MIEKEAGGKTARSPPAGQMKFSFDAAHALNAERAQTMHGLIGYWRKNAVTPARAAPPAAQTQDSELRGLLDSARKILGR